MTEYGETGYGSDRYPPRDGGDLDGGGTVYRGGAQGADQASPLGPNGRGYGESDPPYDPTASIRGRVWRPTRGPRADDEARDPGYGAPQRGWRTSDGGYRSAEGGWRAPYRPYDTGEWLRDERPDTGPTSTGEFPPHSSGSGEIVRYTPPVTGEPPAHWTGAADVANHQARVDRTEQPPRHTGEMVRYRDAGEPPDYAPASGYPASGAPRYPDRYQDDVDGTGRYPAGRARPGGTGEIVPYRGGAAGSARYPGAEPDTSGPGRRRTGETGEIARSPRAAGPRHTGEIARYAASHGTRDAEVPRPPVGYDGAGRARFDTDGRGRSTDGRRTDTDAGRPADRPRFDTDGRGRFADGRRTDTDAGRPADRPRFDTDSRGRSTDGRRTDTDAGRPADRPRFDTDSRGRPAASAGGRGMPGGAVAGGPGTARRSPSGTGEMTRIPRPRPTSPANYPPPAPTRRALESGERRDDSPELYSYDPLTLGGGESPAMRYDRATESYVYDAEPPSGVPEPRPSGIPGPRPSGVPDPRRVPRPPGASLRTPPTTRPDEVRQYGGRGYNGRAPEASVSGAAARYQRERAPEPPDDVPARPPADRRYDQPPPVRRAPARPQQRFEGTYPPRAVRNPRNVVPMQGRPGMASDEDEEEAPGFLHTALVTTAWYTIPLLLYTMYVLTLDGSAQAGDGQSPRESALNGLLGGMPRVGVALVTSLVVALLIRVISNGWRAATIGFASAVVGAGVATVIFTALQG